MLETTNVADCAMQTLWDRGRFRCTFNDLSDALGSRLIGATVYEVAAGDIRGPYHFHDGVEEWMYVISGEPVLRDPAGERRLRPGTLVAFQAGPRGAHTYAGPGRVVMFSAGARGWGEAFTSVYPDADKVGGKPGIRFSRSSALETWVEAALTPLVAADEGPCPQVALLDFPARDGTQLAERLHTQTWVPAVTELEAGEAGMPYRYDWCRECWMLVLAGSPTLRQSGGQSALVAGDIVCLPEGEAGAHQLLNDTGERVRVLTCTAPATGPWASVYPESGTYELRVPGRNGYRFRLADQLADYWDGEPQANPTVKQARPPTRRVSPRRETRR